MADETQRVYALVRSSEQDCSTAGSTLPRPRCRGEALFAVADARGEAVEISAR
jgi:hypothetical protein